MTVPLEPWPGLSWGFGSPIPSLSLCHPQGLIVLLCLHHSCAPQAPGVVVVVVVSLGWWAVMG